MGWTSHDAIAVVRRQLGVRAVGHVGTLDPFASGLLVVLVGKATRLARFIESERKQYVASFGFGRSTDTEDATGTTLVERIPDDWPTEIAIDSELAAMTGVQMQRPPIYSAKQVAGKRSYQMARAGKPLELPEVAVNVKRLERLDWTPPRLTLLAEVGKGTYLRSLARDLGERLEIPAHCAELRRTAIGEFNVEHAVAPNDVTASMLHQPSAMLPHMARQLLSDEDVHELGFGRRVDRTSDADGPAALVASDGRLIAVGEVAEDDRWQPVVVLENA